MYYASINPFDTANGEGIRVSLFVSGCSLRCKGCFNAEARAFDYGQPFTEVTELYLEKLLEQPHIKGLSLLGGDPFEPEHEETLLKLLQRIKSRFPNKDVWAWTGRLYSQVKDSKLLLYIDVLVDGPFIQSKKKPNLQYRGSTNQRIIYLKEEK